ncbi:four-carbon acid sugar kinase family protein [Tianweitania sp. BSSL-BM11]|uniref:Four-carbon acid sugar kinase family protein n=1 Tax=Tianweitania aestuarii TaxID=2814886 RepID=A0ABS5RZU0_9HYPH|nr:four-carbon acid sugar kinase family protein [Tianweitania aestuarii]MBS9721167.1 four-carbon acid sugar kinase family protein [Tianweitania aestuarii]
MVDYVFIGDDFTGASDTLATLAEAGRRVRLFLQAPDPRLVEKLGLDAVGIATDLRAKTPDEIHTRVTDLAQAVLPLAPRIVHYKVCSTFDSAPDVGSIGAAALAIEAVLKPALVAVIGGQPSLGRFCSFGNLFARSPDGAVYRIDRHPIMSRHPVTPMHEADLRLHLSAQGLSELTLVPRTAEGATLAAAEKEKRRRFLFDAMDQTDIENVGQALRSFRPNEPLLLLGSSSVAEAITSAEPKPQNHFCGDGLPVIDGPRLVLAGSRSSATAAQIAAASSYQRVPLSRADITVEGLQTCAHHCAEKLASGLHVLVHLRADLDYGLSPNTLSERLAEMARLILVHYPVRALGVAGGDTSSAVVHRLGFDSLSFESRAGSGVAICRGHASGSPLNGMRLLLKGGQVGSTDLFDNFLT